jgi:putative ABC transport system permease protein
MDVIKKDLRYAIRLFLNRPGFTLIALLTIALGIGINTAIFSVVNGVLLRPLPFPHSERLAEVFTVIRNDLDIFSPSNFLDVQAQNKNFESVAVFSTASFDLATGSEPEAIPGARVSADFFRVLGSVPLLGRTFSAADDIPGSDRVVVISHSLWKDKFHSDSGIIGRTILVNSVSCSVIGVLRPEMEFPENTRIWTPIAFNEEEKTYRGSIYLEMIGRLKPNVPLETAKKELQTIAARLEKDFPLTNRGVGMTAMPLIDSLVGDVRTSLIVLAAAVGFVLLIACANLANLLIANTSTRIREFAVRSALGASQSTLLRQLLTESLLLSLSGGMIGTLFAFWALPTLRALSPAQLPRIAQITIDWRVLFFTLFVSIITGILFGLAPSFGFSRMQLQDSLKEGTRSVGATPYTKRLGNALIICEVGLVLVLLTGAGLMVRSFLQLRSVHPGFNPNNVVSFQLTLPEANYEEKSTRVNFADALLTRLKAIPGTKSVAFASPAPFTGDVIVQDVGFRIYGRPEPNPGEYPTADFTRITPEYFRAMQIPLMKGRPFTEQDREQAPKVMVISADLAKKHFANQNPIGQKIILGRRTPIIFEIVGVVGDVKHLRLNNEVRPEIYLSFYQMPGFGFSVITSTSAPDQYISNLKSQIFSIDRRLPVRFVARLEDLIGRSMAPARASMVLIGVFAGLALLLAVIGLYGLIAYSVSQRTREIGIRVALGAKRINILGLILQKGMVLTIIGALIGIFASFVLTRFLSSLLFQVSPTDPIVFVWVCMILLATAFLACYIPARRASRVDPIVALRYE